MSSYRRLISYIYAYEGKKKGKNIGFVKLEAKEGQCKLGLNVKKVYVEGNDMGVYLLGKDGQETFLSNVFIRNGCGEFRTVVDAVNVMGTGNSLDTYYGLTIHDVKNSWRSYTTIWEDSVSHMAQEELPGTQDKSVPRDQAVSKVVKEIESEIAKEENRKTGEENVRTRAAEIGMPGGEGGMMRRGNGLGQTRQMGQPGQPRQAGQMNQMRQPGQPVPSGRPVQSGQPGQPAQSGRPVQPGQPVQPGRPAPPSRTNQSGQHMEQEKVIVDFSRKKQNQPSPGTPAVHAGGIPGMRPNPGPNPQPGQRPNPGPNSQPGQRPNPGPHPQPQPGPHPGPQPGVGPQPNPGIQPGPGQNPNPGPNPGPRPNPGSRPGAYPNQFPPLFLSRMMASHTDMSANSGRGQEAIPVVSEMPQVPEESGQFYQGTAPVNENSMPALQGNTEQMPDDRPDQSDMLNRQVQLSQPESSQPETYQPEPYKPEPDEPYRSEPHPLEFYQPQAEMQPEPQNHSAQEQGGMISPELENPEVLNYLQETEELTQDAEKLWEELRKSYPKIQPFDYDDGCDILTIRPQDIGRLPREIWVYGNNSFLLHGYYNFRYLILVRLGNSKGKPRYLLGIPGHYYSNEKYMASMFGFPNFVLSKKQPSNDGRFGYWYTDIKMG